MTVYDGYYFGGPRTLEEMMMSTDTQREDAVRLLGLLAILKHGGDVSIREITEALERVELTNLSMAVEESRAALESTGAHLRYKNGGRWG